MKVKQAHISKSVSFFKINFLEKYNLVEKYNDYDPLVMFGMYNAIDYNILKNHKGFVVVVWCGSDSMKIGNDILNIIQDKLSNSVHITTPDFGHFDLNKKNIPNIIIPVTPIIDKIEPMALGEYIYHYGNGKNNFYGDNYISDIKKKTGLKMIETTHITYDKKTLLSEIYPKTFIGLRLTEHDGVPTTVIEMGLMGRKCIFNGSVPHNIKWKGIDDICENIMIEYDNRNNTDYRQISKEINNYINIGSDWLNVNNYK